MKRLVQYAGSRCGMRVVYQKQAQRQVLLDYGGSYLSTASLALSDEKDVMSPRNLRQFAGQNEWIAWFHGAILAWPLSSRKGRHVIYVTGLSRSVWGQTPHLHWRLPWHSETPELPVAEAVRTIPARLRTSHEATKTTKGAYWSADGPSAAPFDRIPGLAGFSFSAPAPGRR